jgi:hypothetical protein
MKTMLVVVFEEQRSLEMFPLFNIRKLVITFAMFAVVGFTSVAVKADTVSFDLTAPNSGIAGFTGPYATVTVNRTDSTHASITVTGLTSGAFTYLLGDGASVGFNISGAFQLDPLVIPNPTFTGGNVSTAFVSGGAGQVNGFGNFNFSLNNTGSGSASSASSITTSFSLTSGSWANAGAVLFSNANGSTAVAHIFVIGSNCGGSPCTGFASNGTESVPEPASMILLGTGLIGVASGLRRRLKK